MNIGGETECMWDEPVFLLCPGKHLTGLRKTMKSIGQNIKVLSVPKLGMSSMEPEAVPLSLPAQLPVKHYIVKGILSA
jgi:hypothetical protein